MARAAENGVGLGNPNSGGPDPSNYREQLQVTELGFVVHDRLVDAGAVRRSGIPGKFDFDPDCRGTRDFWGEWIRRNSRGLE